MHLFAANHQAFRLYGPGDGHDVDRADRWKELVATVVIPNNRLILRNFRANRHLLTPAELATVSEFEIHAAQLEDRHLKGNWGAGTIRFPSAIASVFEEGIE